MSREAVVTGAAAHVAAVAGSTVQITLRHPIELRNAEPRDRRARQVASDTAVVPDYIMAKGLRWRSCNVSSSTEGR